jgi:hypothetical protein
MPNTILSSLIGLTRQFITNAERTEAVQEDASVLISECNIAVLRSALPRLRLPKALCLVEAWRWSALVQANSGQETDQPSRFFAFMVCGFCAAMWSERSLQSSGGSSALNPEAASHYSEIAVWLMANNLMNVWADYCTGIDADAVNVVSWPRG